MARYEHPGSRAPRTDDDEHGGPISEIRWVARPRERWPEDDDHVTPFAGPCVVCGSRRAARQLPLGVGPWFCRECVDAPDRDEFDALYRDLGVSG